MTSIITEEKNRVLYIELNRPEKRNAFDPSLMKGLIEIFQNASQNEERVALVLKGRGKSFSAGADLNYMKSMVNFSLEENIKDAEILFEMFHTLAQCPLPVIALAHGHVMGGGLGLLSACDIVAAEENTLFGFTEVRLGLVASVISPFVLKKIHPSYARLWMLTGDVFKASEALAGGLIHFTGSLSQVEKYVEEKLEVWRDRPLQGIRETKKLINFVEEKPHEGSFKKHCVELIAQRRVSPETQKALKIFLEKKS